MKNEKFENFLETQIDVVRQCFDSLSEEKTISSKASFNALLGFCERTLEQFRQTESQDTFHSWVKIKREEDDTSYVIVGEAKHICFLACKCNIWGDCCNEHVEELYIDGDPCEPPTWEPDMVRTITSKVTGEVLYQNQFTQWEH